MLTEPAAARPEPRRALLKLLLGLVGLVLSALLLSTAFFHWELSGGHLRLVPRFSFEKFVEDLPHHLVWLVPFVLLQASIIPLRAAQWQRTLRKRVPYMERFHLVGIGAFTHNAVPGKLGDVMRSFLLSRTQRIPFVQCLGSVAVCKLLEFASLMLLVALSFAGPFGETMAQYGSKLKVALALCVGLVALVVLLAHHSGRFSRALARRHRMPRLQHLLSHLHDGLGTARSFRGMAVALLFSVGPVLVSALGYGLALRGLGIRGGLFAGAVVLGAISFGQSTPGVPAGMGLYYLVTSWAARSLGAAPEDAAAFSTLTHLGVVIAHVSLGGWSVHRRGIRLRDLRRGGKLARGAAAEVAHVDDPAPAPA